MELHKFWTKGTLSVRNANESVRLNLEFSQRRDETWASPHFWVSLTKNESHDEVEMPTKQKKNVPIPHLFFIFHNPFLFKNPIPGDFFPHIAFLILSFAQSSHKKSQLDLDRVLNFLADGIGKNCRKFSLVRAPVVEGFTFWFLCFFQRVECLVVKAL